MEKQEKNCRPDNLYYCGIVLPLAGILFLALLRLLKIPLNHILLPCIFHKLPHVPKNLPYEYGCMLQ